MDQLSILLKKVGNAFLGCWIMIVVSGWFYTYGIQIIGVKPDSYESLVNAGATAIFITWLIFFLSLALIIIGFVQARKLNEFLNSQNVRGGKMLVWSFLVMFVTLLLSLQSIYGYNYNFSFYINDVDTFWGLVSIVLMILFTLSPVFMFIGIHQISTGEFENYNRVTNLKKVRYGALSLMCVSIGFSPLLISWLNLTTKGVYDPPKALNIITAVAYGSTILFTFLFWLKKTERNIVSGKEKQHQLVKPISPQVKECLGHIGNAYLFVWCTIAVSAIIMFFFYITGWSVCRILTYIVFIIGWATVLYSIYVSIGVQKILSKFPIKHIKLLVLSFLALGVISVLSFNSIYGGNIYMYRKFGYNSLADDLEFIGYIGLILFIIFPLLTFIGTYFMAQRFPQLKRATTGALILLISSIVFSPILLTLNINEIGVPFYNWFALIGYGLGIYFFIPPWKGCDTVIVELDPATSEEVYNGDLEEVEIKNIKDIDIKNELKKDRNLLYYIGVGIASTIASIIFLICTWPKSENSADLKDDSESEYVLENQYNKPKKIKKGKRLQKGTSISYINDDTYEPADTYYEEPVQIPAKEDLGSFNFMGVKFTLLNNGKLKISDKCLEGIYYREEGYYRVILGSGKGNSCGDYANKLLIVDNSVYEIYAGTECDYDFYYNPRTSKVTITDYRGHDDDDLAEFMGFSSNKIPLSKLNRVATLNP